MKPIIVSISSLPPSVSRAKLLSGLFPKGYTCLEASWKNEGISELLRLALKQDADFIEVSEEFPLDHLSELLPIARKNQISIIQAISGPGGVVNHYLEILDLGLEVRPMVPTRAA